MPLRQKYFERSPDIPHFKCLKRSDVGVKLFNYSLLQIVRFLIEFQTVLSS